MRGRRRWLREATRGAVPLFLACTALQAQSTVTPPLGIGDEIRDLLERSAPAFAPSVGLVGGQFESAVNAHLTWPRNPAAPGAQVRLGALGHRVAGVSWGGASLGILWQQPVSGGRLWLGVEGIIGSKGGAGSPGAILARTGGRVGWIGLELRSIWSAAAADVGGHDSLGSALTPVAWSTARRYTEAELSLTRRLGPVVLEGVAGWRFGPIGNQHAWGEATLGFGVTPSVELVASAGSRLARVDRAGVPGTALRLGFRLRAPAPQPDPPVLPAEPVPELSVAPGPDGSWTISVDLPTAARVEMRGDLTAWQPVALTRGKGRGAWRWTVSTPPGVYSVVIRVDGGAWVVPPGLPSVPDGFGGLVGLLLIR